MEITKLIFHYFIGRDYLKRVCNEYLDEEVEFLTISQVESKLHENTEVNTWIGDMKNYLTDNHGELITDNNLIFIIESQVFLTNTTPKRAFSVMVSNETYF